MGEIQISASQWRFVQVGRVLLFTHGIYTDRLGVIVEIIDHKRVCSDSPECVFWILWVSQQWQVLVDGPSTKKDADVPRQSVALNSVIITPIVIKDLPRGAGRGAVKKAWEEEGIQEKWDASAWAKRREQRVKRRNLTDFDRFVAMRLKKQV